ncbi:MAG: helix-turn-helix domain-containing protein [Candidatus Hermodarchaeota archaeon]
MGKKKKTEETRKDLFKKVNLVFKNPIRSDIIQELSNTAQRPIDLADNIGVQKQAINYHLNELKKGGLVKTQKKAIPTTGEVKNTIDDLRGIRVNGVGKDGKLQVSYGVELTENGKKIANEFVNRLYEGPENEKKGKNKKKGGK